MYWLFVITSIAVMIILLKKYDDIGIILIFGAANLIAYCIKVAIDGYLMHCDVKYRSRDKEHALRKLKEQQRYRR